MTLPAMAVEIYLAEAVPNTSASQPSLMDGNNNLANTPAATGALAPPQSPSGAVVTNTGRTQSATAAYFSTLPYKNYQPPLNPYVPPR